MILSCNSCEKKFVVPDNAIGVSGRLVQCSSCGNKWKQFPIKSDKNLKEITPKKESIPKKTPKSSRPKKKKAKKKAGPDLYSPEYLAKKHGIKLNDAPVKKIQSSKNTSQFKFGFYNLLLVYFVVVVALLKILHFSQNIIINIFPFLEVYLNYLFETLRNVTEIIIDFLIIY